MNGARSRILGPPCRYHSSEHPCASNRLFQANLQLEASTQQLESLNLQRELAQAQQRATSTQASLELVSCARTASETAVVVQRRELDVADGALERYEAEVLELHAALETLALEANEARYEAAQQRKAAARSGDAQREVVAITEVALRLPRRSSILPQAGA